MDQEHPETPLRLGIKIERPTSEEKVGFLFIILAILTAAFIAFTIWLLVLEWTGQPLPSFLKLPIA